jgi:hypothetical protein
MSDKAATYASFAVAPPATEAAAIPIGDSDPHGADNPRGNQMTELWEGKAWRHANRVEAGR